MLDAVQSRSDARARSTGRAVSLLCLGVAVIGSNSLLLSPVLGDVAAALATSANMIAIAISSYGGATALSALFLAPRIDSIGAPRAMTLAMALLSIAMAGAATAPHWLMLALAQAVAGLAAGVALPAIYALAVATPERAQHTLGRVLAGWSISLVIGVPLAAQIADRFGWRASYAALALLAAFAAAGARFAFPARIARVSENAPISRRALLGRPSVRALLLICLAYMSAFYGVYAFIGEHLRQTLGLSASEAARLALAYGLGFGAATFADAWAERIQPRRLLALSLVALALIYALLPIAARVEWIVLGLAVLWGVVNHFGLNMIVLLLSRAEPLARGQLLGLNSAVTYAGALLGASVASAVNATLGFAMICIIASLSLLIAAASWRLAAKAPA